MSDLLLNVILAVSLILLAILFCRYAVRYVRGNKNGRATSVYASKAYGYVMMIGFFDVFLFSAIRAFVNAERRFESGFWLLGVSVAIATLILHVTVFRLAITKENSGSS